MASDETVRIICPNLKCRTVLSVPGDARGKSVRCRSCGSRVSVPSTKAVKRPKVVKTEDAPETPDAATTQT